MLRDCCCPSWYRMLDVVAETETEEEEGRDERAERWERTVRDSRFYQRLHEDMQRLTETYTPGEFACTPAKHRAFVYPYTLYFQPAFPGCHEPSAWNRAMFAVFESRIRDACREELCPMLPILLVDPSDEGFGRPLTFSLSAALATIESVDLTLSPFVDGGILHDVDDLSSARTDEPGLSPVLLRLQQLIAHVSGVVAMSHYEQNARGYFVATPLEMSTRSAMASVWFPLHHAIAYTETPVDVRTKYSIYYIDRTRVKEDRKKYEAALPNMDTLLFGLRWGAMHAPLPLASRASRIPDNAFFHTTPIVRCGPSMAQDRYSELALMSGRRPLIIWNFDDSVYSTDIRPSTEQMGYCYTHALRKLQSPIAESFV